MLFFKSKILKGLIIFYGLIFVISFTVAFVVFNGGGILKAISPGLGSTAADTQGSAVGGLEIFYRDQYPLCQELHDQQPVAQRQLTMGELAATGWNDWREGRFKDLELTRPAANRLVITHTHPGLCPEHLRQRHLEPDPTEHYLAVYYGPVEIGKQGGIVRMTTIEVKALPAEIQTAIRNGNINFTSEEELLLSLENYDE